MSVENEKIMSSILYWEPVKKKKGNALLPGLRNALQKRYGSPIKVILNYEDAEYLQGLSDAEIKGASELISAIEKYGSIELREEF